MWSYTFRRVLATIPTLLAVITVCYLLLHLTPGGPFDGERKVSAAVLANLQAKYHLDLPLWQQYLYYIKSLLQGDLGASFRYADWSVNDLVGPALPVSAAIGGGAIVISLFIGVALGIVAALRQNSIIDYLVMLLGNIGGAFPSFVLGPVLVMVFAIGLEWLPAGGWDDFSLRYMVLPMALLVFINISTIGRVMRGSMIEVLGSNFIRTARAKGLPTPRIVFVHGLRAAALPLVSYLGPAVAAVLTGSLVVEQIFGLPGIGRYFVQGALNRDYTLVLGIVLVIGAAIALINALVDALRAWMDPRLRDAQE